MDVIYVDGLYQRLEVAPDVVVGGWRGAVDTVHHDTDTGRLTIGCMSDAQIRREAAELGAALRQLPDPVDLVTRRDEPPEGP